MRAQSAEPWDPRAGGRWWAALFLVPAVLFAFGYALFGTLWALLLPRHFEPRQEKVIRTWGKVMLWTFGVRLEVHGLEHRDAAGAKVIAFNHVALIDMFVLAALWPLNGVVIYKKEFHRIPFIGTAMKTVKMIPVDRQNREDGRRSISQAAALVLERQARVVIAPEGTRSRRRGGILPFKMGPFHLAAETHVPVVPMIMRGMETLMPHGAILARRGTIRVDYLPPISTARWSHETVREHAAEIRRIFLRYYPDAEAAAAIP